LIPTLQRLGLAIEDLYALQLSAFEWSNNVARSAH
jgi:EAL and modified HD-GYP domain-containing signal transduction protein